MSGNLHPYYTVPQAAVRRLPLSPSDTDHEVPPISLSVNQAADFDMASGAGHYLGATPERTRFQSRRTSTLSYQNSGARDVRDRSYSRSPRNLVVVIPPPDLPLDRGHLGNALSMGPRNRLYQGILMPLFPSMLGQLNAIAREYNFPSTVGLCLYLHIDENGITMTPRISDDSWQYLFGHLFDGRPPSGGQQLPIGGSIEFDIDLNKARWFDAWVSGTLRDSDPLFPPITTSRGSLEAHWRGGGQTVDVDQQPVEDRWDASGSYTLFTNSRPETLRHLPKKLSLVDRLELEGVHVSPTSHNHLDHVDSTPTHGTHASSPILPPAIPQVVTSDLERRVNSWRAATELYPASMTETHQPAPDTGVTSVVTTMDEYALDRNFRQADNINEFLWSTTSVGPFTTATESPVTSLRPSSVHLDRCANEAVPLAPTPVSSRDPTHDKLYFDVSSETRLPSPDMGERVIEDVMAPRSRAVWGNSFGWRSAITWKRVYPYSATQTSAMARVQIQGSNGLVPLYPILMVYPAVNTRSEMRSPPSVRCLQPSLPSVWGSSFGWQKEVTWRKVYPYSMATMQLVASVQLRGAEGLRSHYPNLYPSHAVEEDISQPVSVILNDLLTSYPSLVIYPAVYPYLDIYPSAFEGVKIEESSQVGTNIYSMSISYPGLVIYPAVYPHFDLYPNVLSLIETSKPKQEVVTGCLISEYPNMTMYPSAYPHLEIYPAQDTKRASDVVWGVSSGWLIAKTWLQVYPLHTAGHPSTSGKQAVWGSSFGWKSATTWRAVWPTPYTRAHSNVNLITIHLGQRNDPLPSYPYFVIYPATYPCFDIYPPLATIVGVDEPRSIKENQFISNLILHYPNLVIYPAVYPHFDLYPSFARAFVFIERGGGELNLRCRRIEIWGAKTAAQVELAEFLANNHIWEIDEPVQLDLADVGPSTSPLEPLHTPSIPESVHVDCHMKRSVLPTPSTVTTWSLWDDDWYSEISSVGRLPSPGLGQRVLNDAENTQFPYQPWNMRSSSFWNVSQVRALPPVLAKSAFVAEYPRLVIYPPAYPHFELYPAWITVSTSENRVDETLANSDIYPVFDVYPAVYPHFNLYPTADFHIESRRKTVSNIRHERMEVTLTSLYPNFDIYPACYPYNLDYIYPSDAIELAQIPIEALPWPVIDPAVYSFILQHSGFLIETNSPFEPKESPPPTEWKSVNVKLPARYPLLDIYSAGYPWSLESIYPVVSIGDCLVDVKPRYPCIRIYPPVYPFVQPYPGLSGSVHVPGVLDKDEYESVKVFLALSKFKPIGSESVAYPHVDPYPPCPMRMPRQGRAARDVEISDSTTPPPQTSIIPRRHRKTHKELHDSVFRLLGKRPARTPKTYLQLHTEVFQDGAVWTPSGYAQDLSPLITSNRMERPVRQSQRLPSQDNTGATPRPSRSRSGTTSVQSPDKVVFPVVQPPALPPMSLRARSSGIPSQPPPAVSETPMPRVSSPTNMIRICGPRARACPKLSSPLCPEDKDAAQVQAL